MPKSPNYYLIGRKNSIYVGRVGEGNIENWKKYEWENIGNGKRDNFV
jgi:hypothetical protein